jgi:hypothetical protein
MADSETGETAEVQVQMTPAPAIIEVTPLIEERLILKSTKAREGPGRAFGRLANLKKGGRVRVTGQTIDGYWCRVVLAEDGEGFVLRRMLGATREESAAQRKAKAQPGRADATVADFESGLAAYHRGGHAAALPREFTGRSDKDCHQPIKLAKYHYAGA